MAGSRRVVRVTRDLFDEIDRVLGPERGPDGKPSANDFLAADLLRIVERFATQFDELPEHIPGRPDYRMLIAAGVLVHAVAVIGQLNADDSVELVSIRIDDDGSALRP